MSMDDLKGSISAAINADGCGAEFYFLVDGNNGIKIKAVDINSPDHAELETMFIQSVSESILLNDDLSLIPLSSADDRVNAVYKYDLNEVPDELSYLKTIIESENLDTFDFNFDELSNLEGMLILLGNQDKQLAIYKYQYPISLLKRDSGFNIMKPLGQNRFKKLDTDVLKINKKFEFIRIGGEYYILDLKTLEKFFGFHNAIKNVAEKGIENIKNENLVMNCDVFSSRLDEISFSRKLVSSAKNSPVLGVIPNTQIIGFTKNHPALKGKFKYSDDGSQFDLKTKKSQNLFLKLLNDDFLQSELTKLYYDSVAKDSLGDEQ